MQWREKSENVTLLLYTSNCIENFRENNTKALVISNGLKFPQDDRTDSNFIALLKMHFYTSKIESTLGSLKSVINALLRKPSLGAPAYR